MKTFSTALLTCFVLLIQIAGKEKFIENIQIGKNVYSVYSQRLMVHEGKVNSDFYVIYKKGDRKHSLCSAFKNRYAKADGKMVSKGDYQYTDSTVTFKDYTLDKAYMKVDSIIKTYKVVEGGALKLISYVEYNNGVPSRDDYADK